MIFSFSIGWFLGSMLIFKGCMIDVHDYPPKKKKRKQPENMLLMSIVELKFISS